MAIAQVNRLISHPPVALHVGDQPTEVDRKHFQISPRGMVFCSASALSIWTEVSVCMHLPSSAGRPPEQLDCHGVVVTCRRQRGSGWKCTVVFLDLSKKAEARLAKICSPSPTKVSPSNRRNVSSRLASSALAVT